MSLLETVEAELAQVELKLLAALELQAQAILAETEAKAAVKVAQTEYDRVQAALNALRGETMQGDMPGYTLPAESGLEDVTEAPRGKHGPAVDQEVDSRMDAPAEKPISRTTQKPTGAACPGCGERGTLGPATIEIKGKEIQVTACSACSHQVW